MSHRRQAVACVRIAAGSRTPRRRQWRSDHPHIKRSKHITETRRRAERRAATFSSAAEPAIEDAVPWAFRTSLEDTHVATFCARRRRESQGTGRWARACRQRRACNARDAFQMRAAANGSWWSVYPRRRRS